MSVAPGRGRRLRRVLAVVAVVLLAAASAVAVQRAVSRPASLSSRAGQLANDLRCPTCNGESVAASNAPLAQSMRSEIGRQLHAGRSNDQIRSWFVQRYGRDVLLDPTGSGVGAVLVVVPAVALAAGAVGLWLVVRRRNRARDAVPAPATAGLGRLSSPRLVVAGGTCLAVGALVPVVLSQHAGPAAAPASTPAAARPVSARAWQSTARSLDAQHQYGQAVRAYRKALHRRPHAPGVREDLAFDLLRSNRPAAAERTARPVVDRHPGRPVALLVLGLAQRARHEPAADRTLHHFVQRFPDHPAAGQVRRLLAER